LGFLPAKSGQKWGSAASVLCWLNPDPNLALKPTFSWTFYHFLRLFLSPIFPVIYFSFSFLPIFIFLFFEKFASVVKLRVRREKDLVLDH